jgi:hypothetical protein
MTCVHYSQSSSIPGTHYMKLHCFFPLLWITILKYGRLYGKIEIRVAKVIVVIHSICERSTTSSQKFYFLFLQRYNWSFNIFLVDFMWTFSSWCLRTLLRIYEKESNPKKLKNKKYFGSPSCPKFTRILFLGHKS